VRSVLLLRGNGNKLLLSNSTVYYLYIDIKFTVVFIIKVRTYRKISCAQFSAIFTAQVFKYFKHDVVIYF